MILRPDRCCSGNEVAQKTETLSKTWRALIVFALMVTVALSYAWDTTRPITSDWRTLSQASLIKRWMAPMETNAFRRPGLLSAHPEPNSSAPSRDGGESGTAVYASEELTNESLNSVAITPQGNVALAVGSTGTILRSNDSGSSWVSIPLEIRDSLKSVAIASDGRVAIAVGINGTIIKSIDRGETWRAIANPISDEKYDFEPFVADRLIDVSFGSDSKTAIIVGEKGFIGITQDGGEEWTKAPSNVSVQLNSVAISNDNKIAIVVGDEGVTLTSIDGGNTWIKEVEDTEDNFVSVTINEDKGEAYGVGWNGKLLTRRIARSKWNNIDEVIQQHPVSISTGEKGITTLVAAYNGVILRRNQNDVFWSIVRNEVVPPLKSIALSQSSKIALAVGLNGTILRSADAGATWELVHYRRTPSPMFWTFTVLSLALSVILGWRPLVLATVRQTQHVGISGIGVDDSPIDDATKDRLGILPIANALARFLDNVATVPPLVIAVQAPWGRGKSSLMKLLSQSVEARGMRTVWFNAWHQQSDDTVLASLLDAIREHGLPSMWTWTGWRFRGRLLMTRIKKRHKRLLPLSAVLFFAGFTGLLIAIAGRSVHWRAAINEMSAAAWWPPNWANVITADAISSLSELLRGDLGPQLDDPQLFATLGQLLGMPEVLAVLGTAMLTVLGGWMLLAFALQAFPESPAVLLASTSTKFKIGDAQAQTSFRERFRQHFSDVAEALQPGTLLSRH